MHASQKLTHTAANILMTSRGEAESAEARARALQRAPREACPSLQSTLFIAAPQGHSGRNHSVWSARGRAPPPATRHIAPAWLLLAPIERARRGESLFWASDLLPTDRSPRILYRPPPRAGSYNLRFGSCTYLTPKGSACDENHSLKKSRSFTLTDFTRCVSRGEAGDGSAQYIYLAILL